MSPERQVVILVIIYVETFKTDVIIFIGNVMMCLMSQCQYHGQSFDIENIALRSKEKQMTY